MKIQTKIYLLQMFVLMFLLSSCHRKGCTDPHAVNFDVTADKDDGSCIICKTNIIALDSQSTSLGDYNFNSIRYNQTVATFRIFQEVHQPSDNSCGAATSSLRLEITSLINQKMYFSYRLSSYSGPVSISYYDEVTVEPLKTVVVGEIQNDNTPPYLPISIDSLQVQVYTNPGIVYY